VSNRLNNLLLLRLPVLEILNDLEVIDKKDEVDSDKTTDLLELKVNLNETVWVRLSKEKLPVNLSSMLVEIDRPNEILIERVRAEEINDDVLLLLVDSLETDDSMTESLELDEDEKRRREAEAEETGDLTMDLRLLLKRLLRELKRPRLSRLSPRRSTLRPRKRRLTEKNERRRPSK